MNMACVLKYSVSPPSQRRGSPRSILYIASQNTAIKLPAALAQPTVSALTTVLRIGLLSASVPSTLAEGAGANSSPTIPVAGATTSRVLIGAATSFRGAEAVVEACPAFRGAVVMTCPVTPAGAASRLLAACPLLAVEGA